MDLVVLLLCCGPIDERAGGRAPAQVSVLVFENGGRARVDLNLRIGETAGRTDGNGSWSLFRACRTARLTVFDNATALVALPLNLRGRTAAGHHHLAR
jgi:hypothetical protein